VVNFPHNPTGAHLTAAEQERIVSIARACGAFVLSDEMYRGLEHAPSHPTLPAMCEVYEKGISLAGMSKVYALPGLRVGWLVSPAANGFLAACASLKDYTTICGSAPSEALALMALRRRDELLERSKRIVADGLEAVDAFFGRHKELAHYHRPMAGPICYPAFKGDGLTAADVMAYARELVGATGVLLLPGGACYDVDKPGGGGAHFRVGLGRLDLRSSLREYERALEEPRFRKCSRRQPA
jgi:aspartate/methionine/tyrosine aminotransferase